VLGGRGGLLHFGLLDLLVFVFSLLCFFLFLLFLLLLLVLLLPMAVYFVDCLVEIEAIGLEVLDGFAFSELEHVLEGVDHVPFVGVG
jgi:hypothetical protein